MSRNPPPQPAATLIAKAGPGVGIRVLDHSFSEIARGTGVVQLSPPDGLYVVEWSSGGMQAERIVRLSSEDGPVVVDYDPHQPSSDAISGSATGPSTELVDAVGEGLRPSERSYGASIAVVVSADPALSAGEASRGIRLISGAEKLMRASSRDLPKVDLDEDDLVRCFRVRPGRYRLQFRSITGETLEQTVPALPGRQTILFLRASSTTLLVPAGEGFVSERSSGIDPALTVMVSVDGGEEDHRIRERVRLAGVLLHDLAAGTNSLSSSFLKVLDDSQTDPLLRLYGALVALEAIGNDRPMVAGGNWPVDPEKVAAYKTGWGEQIRDWLPSPRDVGVPPDATTAWWELRRIVPAVVEDHGPEDIPMRIHRPPMFECSWRWAIAESVRRPDAIVGTASLAAVIRSAGGATPWLCWKAAAAIAAPLPSSPELQGDLESLIHEVAAKAQALKKRISATGPSANPLDELSPDIRATALRLAQMTNSIALGTTALPSTSLALSLALPGKALERRLLRTSDELDRILSTSSSGPFIRPPGNTVGPASDAPALKRKVRYRDDPHKGRFGEADRRGGYRVRARFHAQSKEWTQITIILTGDADDGTRAYVYLHESFTPAIRQVSFKKGRAQIEVTAWGGFTVGVWIPSAQCELELDLAQLPKAPRNIRLR